VSLEPSYPHAADLRLIPFEFDAESEGRSSGYFELTADLCRPDGALYGGTGVAASVMAMEAATQRDALWVLTQFVAPAAVGSRIDWRVRTLALGGRIAQLEVVATVDEHLIFCALGASAIPRPNGLDARFLPMPAVSPPDDSPPMHRGGTGVAFRRHVEFREAELLEPSRANYMALWARRSQGEVLTRAGVAFLADMVPVAIARGAGVAGAGFSLDNALRFGDAPATEWVLLELRGDMASHGYGHGSLVAWASDGTLVATGSQTANMTAIWDGGESR
jgi:acyl-CoA thioesterase-2